MREHAKPTKGSSKRFRSLLIITIVLVTAALAAGAAAVVSRQSAAPNETGARAEGGTAVANNTGDAGKKSATATPAQPQVQSEAQDAQSAELSPEDAQKLAAGLKPMLNKSSEGLQEVHHADGSVSIDVEDRLQSVAVAQVGKDGKVKVGCVDSPSAAAGFFGIDQQLIDGKESARPSTPTTRAKTRN
jgi:flagellar basal body-associated protein FliL